MLIAAIFALWALAISISDIARLKVPNGLLLVVAVPAMAYQLIIGLGLMGVGLSDALIAAGLAFALTLTGYAVHQVGAADVKYAALLGFLSGTAALPTILLVAALVIGLLSLAALAESKWRHVSARKVPAAFALSLGFVAHLAGG